jgi:hypothetical protein
MQASQLIIAFTVGDRRMHKGQILGGDDGEQPRWLAASGEDVEDDVVALGYSGIATPLASKA